MTMCRYKMDKKNVATFSMLSQNGIIHILIFVYYFKPDSTNAR